MVREAKNKKEFWILTNKCGNNLEHENEAEWPWQNKKDSVINNSCQQSNARLSFMCLVLSSAPWREC